MLVSPIDIVSVCETKKLPKSKGDKTGPSLFEDIYQNAFEPMKILYWHIQTFSRRFVIYTDASS